MKKRLEDAEIVENVGIAQIGRGFATLATQQSGENNSFE